MSLISEEDAGEFLLQIKQSVERDIIGQEDVIDGLIAALFTGGHVLLESNPGLGKTTLAKSFARSLKMTEGAEYGRIQFTPDLLPSDITGTFMPDRSGGDKPFVFEKGPIFRQLLLADEINRATPKTQSAMLEAMAECQVTVLGEEKKLVHKKQFNWNFQQDDYLTPFMVIGTQNPIDQEGTYDLPEAQLDRFQLKLFMERIDTHSLVEVVSRVSRGERMGAGKKPPLRIDDYSSEQCGWYIHQIKLLIERTDMATCMLQHAANLVQATHGMSNFEQMIDPDTRGYKELGALVEQYFEWPLGPRAAISLVLTSKAKALLLYAQGNAPKMAACQALALVQMAPGVLRHRLKFKYGWLRQALDDFPSLTGYDSEPEKIRDALILHLLALTAPSVPGYHEFFQRFRLN